MYNKIYCCILMLRAYISCLDIWHLWLYKIPTNKKCNKWLTRNIIVGHVWIIPMENNQKTNIKNNTKMGDWEKNASAMAIPVPWPEPYKKRVGWTEEEKHHRGTGNLKGLDWIWVKECSLISCQVFSNLIRHNRRKLRAIILANGGLTKY